MSGYTHKTSNTLLTRKKNDAWFTTGWYYKEPSFTWTSPLPTCNLNCDGVACVVYSRVCCASLEGCKELVELRTCVYIVMGCLQARRLELGNLEG